MFFQLKDESVPASSGVTIAQKLVTADGTYATQSAFSSDVKASGGKARKDKVTNCYYDFNNQNRGVPVKIEDLEIETIFTV